jgi:hypothetical protein
MSTQFSLKKGDKVDLLNPFYKEAKVDGLIVISQGLQEVRFDIDPRA